MYNAIIRHLVCNYIDNPLKDPFLKVYIPEQFSTGKEYTVAKNMHNFSTWRTEIEIIALLNYLVFMLWYLLNIKLGPNTSMIPLTMILQKELFI